MRRTKQPSATNIDKLTAEKGAPIPPGAEILRESYCAASAVAETAADFQIQSPISRCMALIKLRNSYSTYRKYRLCQKPTQITYSQDVTAI